MKIFAAFAAALICALACAAEKTIDASSDERLQETFFDALSSLDEASQQKFASSMATIGVILAQKYGEAAGILAGDGLLTYAFETACRAFSMTEDPARVGRALAVLAQKAGYSGMVGGQSVDVALT
ncbi:MAG: hypothetical protein IJI37_05955, partial [Opitutales bacterium]|nr:hypothetical protein [Opitutales bacterium]